MILINTFMTILKKQSCDSIFIKYNLKRVKNCFARCILRNIFCVNFHEYKIWLSIERGWNVGKILKSISSNDKKSERWYPRLE